jgi:hypothetical protein
MSNRFVSTNPDLHAGSGSIDSSLDLVFGVEVDSASGAIGITEGYVFITKAGVAAMTLALPNAGLPSAGGDDGRVLVINSTTAHAHTVTTPGNGINGNTHIATFSGDVTDSLELVAYNGAWRTVSTPSGITLS